MSAAAPVRPRVSFDDVVIIGGGCYGTFYARQLARAREEGQAEYRRVLVVDRNPDCRYVREVGDGEDRTLVVSEWDGFFDQYLAGPPAAATPLGPPAVIVPSPHMPHLMYEWVLRRARARWPGREVTTRPLELGPGTPYDRQGPDGTRWVSYADWICPTHCVEPALCPVTRAPRTWEMAEALGDLTRRLARAGPVRGPVLFRCEHQVFGVGTFSVTEVLAGDQAIHQAGAEGAAVDVLVGTISSCHGAASLLHLGPG